MYPVSGDGHLGRLAAMFEKPNQQSHFRLCSNECLLMWVAYFCMGAYEHNVVVVIKMGAYTHGSLISIGANYPNFTGCL